MNINDKGGRFHLAAADVHVCCLQFVAYTHTTNTIYRHQYSRNAMATLTKGSTNTTALLTLYTGTKIRGAQWRRAQRFHEYNGVHYGVRLTWPRLGPRLRPTLRLHRSDAQRLSTRYRPKPTPRRQTTLCKTLAHAARLPMVRKGAACIPLSSQHSATEKQRGPRRMQRRGLPYHLHASADPTI